MAHLAGYGAPFGAAPSLGPEGDLDGLQERAGLVDRLLVLRGGIGVGDDPAPGLDVYHAVLEQCGAQRDAGVKVAVVPEIPERPGVEAPLEGLLLRDDLHRAHLRGPAHGAGREGGP